MPYDKQAQHQEINVFAGVGGDSGVLNTPEASLALNVEVSPGGKKLRMPRQATVVSADMGRHGQTGHGFAIRAVEPDAEYDLSNASILVGAQCKNEADYGSSGQVRGMALHRLKGGASHTDAFPGDAATAQAHMYVTRKSGGTIQLNYLDMANDGALNASWKTLPGPSTQNITHFIPPSVLSDGRIAYIAITAVDTFTLYVSDVTTDWDNWVTTTVATTLVSTNLSAMAMATNHHDQVFAVVKDAVGSNQYAYRFNARSDESDLDKEVYSSGTVPQGADILSVWPDMDGNFVFTTSADKIYKVSRNIVTNSLWDAGGKSTGDLDDNVKIAGVDARGFTIVYDASYGIQVYDVAGNVRGTFVYGTDEDRIEGSNIATMTHMCLSENGLLLGAVVDGNSNEWILGWELTRFKPAIAYVNKATQTYFRIDVTGGSGAYVPKRLTCVNLEVDGLREPCVWALATHATENNKVFAWDMNAAALGDVTADIGVDDTDEPEFTAGDDPGQFRNNWPQAGELHLETQDFERMRSVQMTNGTTILAYGDNAPFVLLDGMRGPVPAGLLRPVQQLTSTDGAAWADQPEDTVNLSYAWARPGEPCISDAAEWYEVDLTTKHTNVKLTLTLPEGSRDPGVTHWHLLAYYTGQAPKIAATYPVTETVVTFDLSTSVVGASAPYAQEFYRATPPPAKDVKIFRAAENVPVVIYYGQEDDDSAGKTCDIYKADHGGTDRIFVKGNDENADWARQHLWKEFVLPEYGFRGSIIDIDLLSDANYLVVDGDIPSELEAVLDGSDKKTGLEYKILGRNDRFWYSYVTPDLVSYPTTVPLANEVIPDWADSDEIQAVECVGSHIYVFGKHHVFIGRGDAAGFYLDRQSTEIGAVSPGAVWRRGDEVFFWSERGPIKISAAGIAPVADMLNARDKMMDDFDPDSYQHIQVGYLPREDVMVSTDLLISGQSSDATYAEVTDPSDNKYGNFLWSRLMFWTDQRVNQLVQAADTYYAIITKVDSDAGTFTYRAGDDDYNVSIQGGYGDSSDEVRFYLTFEGVADEASTVFRLEAWDGPIDDPDTTPVFLGRGSTTGDFTSNEREIKISADAWGDTWKTGDTVQIEITRRYNFISTAYLTVTDDNAKTRLLFGNFNGYVGEMFVENTYTNTMPISLNENQGGAVVYKDAPQDLECAFLWGNFDFGANGVPLQVLSMSLLYDSVASAFDVKLLLYDAEYTEVRRPMNLTVSSMGTAKRVWVTEKDQLRDRGLSMPMNHAKHYVLGFRLDRTPDSWSPPSRHLDIYGVGVMVKPA